MRCFQKFIRTWRAFACDVHMKEMCLKILYDMNSNVICDISIKLIFYHFDQFNTNLMHVIYIMTDFFSFAIQHSILYVFNTDKFKFIHNYCWWMANDTNCWHVCALCEGVPDPGGCGHRPPLHPGAQRGRHLRHQHHKPQVSRDEEKFLKIDLWSRKFYAVAYLFKNQRKIPPMSVK